MVKRTPAVESDSSAVAALEALRDKSERLLNNASFDLCADAEAFEWMESLFDVIKLIATSDQISHLKIKNLAEIGCYLADSRRAMAQGQDAVYEAAAEEIRNA